MKFTDFDLDEKLLKGIEKAGFTECLPVQEKSLEYTLAGKDVSVKSQTGSGKTAAFMIPVLQYYCTVPGEERVRTLIVAPTRELAVQIENDARILGSEVDVTIASFYGGVGYKQQEDSLLKGTDIIIGTPGRLLDFGKSGKIRFKEIGKVVIDEADRLFDMGFYPDIKTMMKMLPPREKRQTMLFSATLSSRVQNLAWDFMNLPEQVEMESQTVTVEEISQVLYHVSTKEKMPLLLGILKKMNPDNAIIFTNTKYAAVEVAERLKLNGYHVMYIMGDLPQKKRLSVIKKVKSGEVKFLVATDVAARGLHVDDLELVINYDIPEDYENYVHRIGRTARAGKSGKAVTFACEKFVYGLEAIEKYIGFKIPVEWADDELFAEDKSAGVRLNIRSNDRRPSGGRDRDRNRRGSAGSRPRGRSGDRRGSDSRRSDSRRGERKPGKPEGRHSGDGRKKYSGGGRSPDRKSAAPGVKRGRPSGEKSRVPLKKLSSSSTAEERLAYYRAKYGEDFKFSDIPDKSAEKQKGDRKTSSLKKSSSMTSGKKPENAAAGRKGGILSKIFRKK